MTRIPTTVAIVILTGLLAAGAEDPDPIRSKLDKAKSVYDAQVQQYRKDVDDYFNRRDDAARKSVRDTKKLVDQVKADRKLHEDRGELPKTAPPNLRPVLAAARTQLERAYNQAVNEYTRAKQDELAARVEKEFNVFKSTDALARAAAAGNEWKQLFNGKDLAGWKSEPDQKNWKVVNGTIEGNGPGGTLSHERTDFQDFHVRLEALINDGGNGGLFLRNQSNGRYEAQINSTARDPKRTGSFFVLRDRLPTLTPADVATGPPPGKWFTLEAIAKGYTFAVYVNGSKTGEFTDKEQHFDRGSFALQALNPGGVVHVRKIEVLELKPEGK